MSNHTMTTSGEDELSRKSGLPHRPGPQQWIRIGILGLLGGRLQLVLIVSFALVAGLTVGLSAVVISSVVDDYLVEAESERVSRDMSLAEFFYNLKMNEIAAVGHRLVQDPSVVGLLPSVIRNDAEALTSLNEEISRKITIPYLGGTHLIVVIDSYGNALTGSVLHSDGRLARIHSPGNWESLPIVAAALSSIEEQTATEVIPVEFLRPVGLDQQARIDLKDTPKAAPKPFNPGEGTAGLAMTGVYPIRNEAGDMIAALLVAYLFNNDFTLVDQIKEAAGVDTVTIFFGDLRVSTNVPDEQGNRAVGTRVSQEVYDVVLLHGEGYKGEAFVVNENYITRYEPLRNHRSQVVGILYVGARASVFEYLVQSIDNRVVMIALICLGLASIIAIPIARIITRPVAELVEANRQLAEGDMSVRIKTHGSGELAVLGQSFNIMVEMLHKAQQKLLHQEKLASVGQLAAGIAHEINNPLGTILLISDVLYKETEPGDPRREDLQMILAEARRCKNIVADLLNFSRQQEMLSQETDVHALLDEVIKDMQLKPRFEGVGIIRQFSPHLGTIMADPDQLKQVFINLLDNAAEALSSNGTITLATTMKDMDWVEIRISDTGCGISQQNLGKLFTPFFTTKAPGKGTGLGLSIVYGIIKMHRGQISVQSEVGKGTTFSILLPQGPSTSAQKSFETGELTIQDPGE